MKKIGLAIALSLAAVGLFAGGAKESAPSIPKASAAQPTRVLIVSDHTYPAHVRVSDAGADGYERLYIDPVAHSLADKLAAMGVQVSVLNVEDLTDNGLIDTEAKEDAAYGAYDEVLKAHVAAKSTIIAIHFDADVITDDKGTVTYTGGSAIIEDERAYSDASKELAASLIAAPVQLLKKLEATGLRTRADAVAAPVIQKNLTLKIIGASEGAGLLLETGPMRQAIRLFGSPEETAQALDLPIATLATAIKDFRVKKGLPLK